MRVPSALILTCVPLLASCSGLESCSHVANPLGWPSRALHAAGFWAADSRLPLLRESGRLLRAVADLVDSPALLLESTVTLDADRLQASTAKLAVGTGGTLTAALNLPFFFVVARNVDLSQDADLVNDALEHMESLEPSVWRYYPGDTREHILPPGTRVRASGKNLIWSIPGQGDILQAGEESLPFRLGQSLAGDYFTAQERSWGFVVGRIERWNERGARQRSITIIHELYHQHMQMRRVFLGWTTIYWPAYGYSFLTDGWWDHWAERQSRIAAYVVEKALGSWRPPVIKH